MLIRCSLPMTSTVFDGLVDTVLAFQSQGCEFSPDRGRQHFGGILMNCSHTSSSASNVERSVGKHNPRTTTVASLVIVVVWHRKLRIIKLVIGSSKPTHVWLTSHIHISLFCYRPVFPDNLILFLFSRYKKCGRQLTCL